MFKSIEKSVTRGQPELKIPAFSRKDTILHAISLSLNATLTLWGIVWVARHWEAVNPSWHTLAFTLVIGLFLADFLSGLLHWAFDTWFDVQTPYIERLVAIVREHHIYPHHIFHYSFRNEAGTMSWSSLIFTVPVYWIAAFGDSSVTTLGHSAIMVCIIISLGMIFMLEFHKFGHRKSDSKLVLILQALGMLMSTKHHLQHHRANHDVRYCIINGWANRVLDPLGFWRWMERAVCRVTGAIPRNNDYDWLRRYGRLPK